MGLKRKAGEDGGQMPMIPMGSRFVLRLLPHGANAHFLPIFSSRRSTLFVSNLSYATTQESLQAAFDDLGPVRSCFVVYDKDPAGRLVGRVNRREWDMLLLLLRRMRRGLLRGLRRIRMMRLKSMGGLSVLNGQIGRFVSISSLPCIVSINSSRFVLFDFC